MDERWNVSHSAGQSSLGVHSMKKQKPTFMNAASRVDKMRANFPAVEMIRGEDGVSFIRHIGRDPSRDDGGFLVEFEFSHPSISGQVISGKATVDAGFHYEKLREYEEAEGIRILDLPSVEYLRLCNKIKELYGYQHKVNSFTLGEELNEKDFLRIRDSFCSLYLVWSSSYAMNCKDEEFSLDDYYPDEIRFAFPGLAREHAIWMSAFEVSTNG